MPDHECPSCEREELIDDDEEDRPLDVNAIMAELQAVVDADRRGVPEEPVFVAGGTDDKAEDVHFDMALLHSTRPVVGGAITATKRAVARSSHTVLEDFANQVMAAPGELRETADTAASQPERVYLALDELRSRVEHLARLEARPGEIDDIAARIDAIGQLALEDRLARLERHVADDWPVAPAPPTAPIPMRVGGMAIARARIDHVTDDRLPAHWSVLDTSAPILNLTPGRADVVDSQRTVGFTVRSVDADPVDAALSGASYL